MVSEDEFAVVKDAQNVSCTLKCVNLAGCFQAFPYQRDICCRRLYRKKWSVTLSVWVEIPSLGKEAAM
jgi:hypothetical protein